MVSLQTGKESNCAALAKATEDDAVVRYSSGDLAGDDVVNKSFALGKSIGIEV